MKSFKKDRNFLLKSFFLNALVFGTLNFCLAFYVKREQGINLSTLALPLILLGLIMGLISATAFHNASHYNIKPRLLNWIIGELTASFSLEDMRCFRVGHMLHHMHSDDPDLDPHPPGNLSFLEFIAVSRQKTITCIANQYYKFHGKSLSSERNVSAQIFVFHIAAVMKLIFWFLLFGPFGFLFFYIPTYLAYFFGFAHLNYISHKEEAGETVHNHNETLFYRVMNVLTSGGYYHKSHHQYPKLYNPRKARMRE
jgi:fatty acid desaturase